MEDTYGSFNDSMRKVRNPNDLSVFWGLEKDIYLLPSIDNDKSIENLNSGSQAICVDTGRVYVYLKSTNKWYKQP